MHLEYRLAFDLAWSVLAEDRGHGAPMLLVLSAPAFLSEVMARLDDPACVVASSPVVSVEAMQLATEGALREDVIVRQALDMELRAMTEKGFESAVWACPDARNWERQVASIDAALANHGRLVLIQPTRRTLRIGRASRQALNTTGSAWPAKLSALGYRLEQHYAIGGPPSLLWAGVGRAARGFGRPDLADGCEAGYRMALATPIRPKLARLRVWICRKGGQS